ncbi:MAG TPA: alanine--glyoxylate aminotransferase family protein, partial [Acidimicrobiales bacterium]|nr:alanine--glyoxylate aminotransferase family protein [Acidimicrobiales bacterium]
GLAAAIARHEACGRQLQDGLEAMGLELVAPAGHRLPQLTTVRIPDGVDDLAVRKQLLERHGIEIGGGLGPFAGTVWRIGCMGHTARPRNVALVLAALAEAIGRPGDA